MSEQREPTTPEPVSAYEPPRADEVDTSLAPAEAVSMVTPISGATG